MTGWEVFLMFWGLGCGIGGAVFSPLLLGWVEGFPSTPRCVKLVALYWLLMLLVSVEITVYFWQQLGPSQREGLLTSLIPLSFLLAIGSAVTAMAQDPQTLSVTTTPE